MPKMPSPLRPTSESAAWPSPPPRPRRPERPDVADVADAADAVDAPTPAAAADGPVAPTPADGSRGRSPAVPPGRQAAAPPQSRLAAPTAYVWQGALAPRTAPSWRPRAPDFDALFACVAQVQATVHEALTPRLQGEEQLLRECTVAHVVEMQNFFGRRGADTESYKSRHFAGCLDAVLWYISAHWPAYDELAHLAGRPAVLAPPLILASLVDRARLLMAVDAGAELRALEPLLNQGLPSLLAQTHGPSQPTVLAWALHQASVVAGRACFEVMDRARTAYHFGSCLLRPYSRGLRTPEEDCQAFAPLLLKLRPLQRQLHAETMDLADGLRHQIACVADRRMASLRALRPFYARATAPNEAADLALLPTHLPCPVFARRMLPVGDVAEADQVLSLQELVLSLLFSTLAEVEAVARMGQEQALDLPCAVARGSAQLAANYVLPRPKPRYSWNYATR